MTRKITRRAKHPWEVLFRLPKSNARKDGLFPLDPTMVHLLLSSSPSSESQCSWYSSQLDPANHFLHHIVL